MANLAEFQAHIRRIQKGLMFETFLETLLSKVLDEFGSEENRTRSILEYKRYLEPLFGDELLGITEQVVRRYDDVAQAVNMHYNDLGDDIQRDLQKVRSVELINDKEWGQYEAHEVDRMARALRDATMANETKEQLYARLKGVGGKTANFAKVLAYTQIKSHSRVMLTEKANVAGVFYYKYVGPPVWTAGFRLSHRLCIELMRYQERTFHIDEIKQMRNSEREPVLYHCGGYYCRHQWQPDVVYKSDAHSVYFIDVMHGKRIIRVGRHVNAAQASGWEIQSGNVKKKGKKK
jgi:hypothetical protein